MPVQCSQSQHRAHGKFGLVHGVGVSDRPQHVNGALVHTRHHRGHVVGAQAMLLEHRQQGVGGGVGVPARGVVLEGGLCRGPAAAQAVGQAGGVGVAGHACGHALRPLQNVARTGQAFSRQAGGGQPRGGSVRGVQLLGVGGIAQELPQAGRLRAGRAQGVQHGGRVQAQQAPGRGGRRHRARSARGVKHLVVRASQKFAHAYAHLIARHRRHQKLTAAAAQLLGHGKRHGKHHGSRVEDRGVVHIVLLHKVRGRRIHSGRHHGAAAAAPVQHFARPLGRPLREPKPRERLHRARVFAGQGRAHPVEEQVFGAPEHRGGNLRVLQRGRKTGQVCAGVGGGHGKVNRLRGLV